MTFFDLVFIVAFLTAAGMLCVTLYALARGRRDLARRLLLRLGVMAGAYFGILILVSLVSPRRVLKVGEMQCWDDWCITVTDVQRTSTRSGVRFEVELRLSSRARRRPQRERGVSVYLWDSQGRRYEAASDRTAVPFDILLEPGGAVSTLRVFDVPLGTHDPVLIVSHGGGFPGCFIIGDSESLLHEPTVVRLD
jgi:hypothetical protein